MRLYYKTCNLGEQSNLRNMYINITVMTFCTETGMHSLSLCKIFMFYFRLNPFECRLDIRHKKILTFRTNSLLGQYHTFTYT